MIESVAAEIRDRGYVVLHGFMPAELCDEARAAFGAEIRDYPGGLLRQGSARSEPHKRNSANLITNPILGFHHVEAQRFERFVAAGLAIVSYPSLVALLRQLVGRTPALIETMYFESSMGNGVHADAHYMDALQPGLMVGAWIALEDIAPEAGRFFVYPRSQLLGTPALGGAASYRDYEASVTATNRAGTLDPVRRGADRARSRRRIRQLIAELGLEAVSPALARGDVVLWHARTLHGSHPPSRDDRSRHSITAHYVPADAGSYLVHGIASPLDLVQVGEIAVHRHRH